jgi:hypothetical protein
MYSCIIKELYNLVQDGASDRRNIPYTLRPVREVDKSERTGSLKNIPFVF